MVRSSGITTAERRPVQTYKIYVSKGRDRMNEIRSELFVFPEILDVFITGRPDWLVVVCRGPAAPRGMAARTARGPDHAGNAPSKHAASRSLMRRCLQTAPAEARQPAGLPLNRRGGATGGPDADT
jgi:hypothetical protein